MATTRTCSSASCEPLDPLAGAGCTSERSDSRFVVRSCGLPDRQSPDADVVVGEDHDGAGLQVFGYCLEVTEDRRRLMFWAAIALAEEQEARQKQTSPGNEFAEVGVGCDEDAPLVKCRGEHFLVDVANKVSIGDMDDIVPGAREEWRQAAADALIEKELHAGVRSGTCRSLTAAAANSRAARTSSADSCE